MFNSNIRPTVALLKDTAIPYASELPFNLSRLLKVKPHCAIGLPTHNFLLVCNSNIELNSAPLRDIRLQNLSELQYDLSRSFKVKCNSAIWIPHIWFLFTYNNNNCQ